MQKTVEIVAAATVALKHHQVANLPQEMERENLPLCIFLMIQNMHSAAEINDYVLLFFLSAQSAVTKAIYHRC